MTHLEIVGKDPLILDLLAANFREAGRFKVEVCPTFAEALPRIRKIRRKALVLIDLHDATDEVVRILYALRKRSDKLRILLLGGDGHGLRDGVRGLLNRADGYAAKAHSLRDLEQAMDDVLAKRRHYPPEIVEELIKTYAETQQRGEEETWISPKAHRLILDIQAGLTLKEIAVKEQLSSAGIESRIRKLAEEWGLPTARRSAVLREAGRRGWI